MFSIDLLKGKGRPEKYSPRQMLTRAVPFVVPVLLVAAWAVSYQSDCAKAASHKAAIADNRSLVETQAKNVKMYQKLNSQTNALRLSLKDLNDGLRYRLQFSDLLVAFVETLPDDIFVEEVELDRKPMIDKRKDSTTGNITPHLLISRQLNLTLCRYDTGGDDQMVWDYIDALKRSEMLAPVFVDFKLAAQQQGTIDERSATYYEIECILRKQG
ncbi:MAG: hypothetical protein ACYSUT_09760 [Planctomycetota bacterium]|jgi:hypothetical protein